MTNIASALKSEIARVARKELRSTTQTLKKSVAQHRGSIAELKRRIAGLERELKVLRKFASNAGPRRGKAAPELETGVRHRFRPAGLTAHRKRLGLSAEAYGALMGVTGQTVRNWEAGTRPRQHQLEALAALRRIGKREAAARLAPAK